MHKLDKAFAPAIAFEVESDNSTSETQKPSIEKVFTQGESIFKSVKRLLEEVEKLEQQDVLTDNEKKFLAKYKELINALLLENKVLRKANSKLRSESSGKSNTNRQLQEKLDIKNRKKRKKPKNKNYKNGKRGTNFNG